MIIQNTYIADDAILLITGVAEYYPAGDRAYGIKVKNKFGSSDSFYFESEKERNEELARVLNGLKPKIDLTGITIKDLYSDEELKIKGLIRPYSYEELEKIFGSDPLSQPANKPDAHNEQPKSED